MSAAFEKAKLGGIGRGELARFCCNNFSGGWRNSFLGCEIVWKQRPPAKKSKSEDRGGTFTTPLDSPSALPSFSVGLHGIATMHLMYYLDESGKRVYTLKVSHVGGWSESTILEPLWLAHHLLFRASQKETPTGKVTESAHPARFSPDDKFSAQRVALKKRFGIFLPDTPQKPL